MQVGVPDAELEKLARERPPDSLARRLAVDAVLAQRLLVGELERVRDEFHDQYLAVRRHQPRRPAARARDAHAHSLHGVPLLLEVKLPLDGAADVLGELAPVVVRPDPRDRAGERSREEHVLPEERLHPALAHLDGHFDASHGHGAVDLRDARRPHGRRIELIEGILDARDAQRLAHGGLDLFRGPRRHGVLQRRQRAHENGGHRVGPRTHALPHLDPHAALVHAEVEQSLAPPRVHALPQLGRAFLVEPVSRAPRERKVGDDARVQPQRRQRAVQQPAVVAADRRHEPEGAHAPHRHAEPVGDDGLEHRRQRRPGDEHRDARQQPARAPGEERRRWRCGDARGGCLP
mmetsp:Transcript_10591/g.43786  ORF Transcript_10591/g.43786 Transcript_10591/m.43786 type:complete len:348 (+) Transcript_10591:2082-3125(+)